MERPTMERRNHSKKKKPQLESTHHERVQVALSINKVMVHPLIELLQNMLNINDEDRNWKFINKLVNLITHLDLKTMEMCQEKSCERNGSNKLADLKKWMKKKLSKGRIKIKNLHVAGSLQLGCSVTMSNQLEDVKKAEPCACDNCQDPLPSTPTFQDMNFEQITSTCRAELCEYNGANEAENDLRDISSDGDNAEMNEGIIESCKGSNMHENNKACLDDEDSNDVKVKDAVENYEGSNMHEKSVDKDCLYDIDDGGTVCEDFPHNPVFSYRFTELKWLKSLGNFEYSSTWEDDSKHKVRNGKAEGNAFLQGVDLMSDLSETDECSNLLLLNEIVGLEVEDKGKLKDDNVSVVLEVEDKVKLKGDGNVSVGLEVEDKVKLKGDGNVSVGLEVEDKVKLKGDGNIFVGLKFNDKVKLKGDDNVTVGLEVEDKVKLKDDNVSVGLEVEDKVKLKGDGNVSVGLKFNDKVKLKGDDNVTVGLEVENKVKLKGEDTLNVTAGLKYVD